MTVTLRDITKANWQECANLNLAPGQEHFVASNAYSLAESKFQPTFVPLAIYAGETMVGFVMYGYYPDGVPPLGHRYWIYHLTSNYRPELGEDSAYITLCEACGWERIKGRSA